MRKQGSPLELNGEYLITMVNNSRYNYELWPRACQFKLAVKEPVAIEFFAEPGEVYYLRIKVIQEGGEYRQVMERVSAETANSYFNSSKVRNLGNYNPVKDSLRMVKTMLNWSGSDIFSLGISLGSGLGFENKEMVVLQNGGSSKISGGGGVMVGAEVIYRFLTKLAVVGNFEFQSSSLTPYVKNASVTFDRVTLGLSPRISLPFGNRFRLNAGPGIALFQGAVMNADLTKLSNGFKGKFNYSSSTAYFFSGDLEYYFRSFSMGLGMKYSTNTYTLTSANVDGYSIPLEDKQLDYYRDFDGSGLFFYAVFRVHL